MDPGPLIIRASAHGLSHVPCAARAPHSKAPGAMYKYQISIVLIDANTRTSGNTSTAIGGQGMK
eukprot:2319197-Pyramimonas_sp.AAC.1